MLKGYWIAHGTVSDPVGYEAYRQANRAAFAKFDAKFLVRGGAQTVVEGDIRPRTVVIEFPSLQSAIDCYYSPEYQAAKTLRLLACTLDLSIIEGWQGVMPQTDGEAVRAVMRQYLEGMIYGDAVQLERAFHPKAQIAGHWHGEYDISGRDAFIASCVVAKDQPAGTTMVFEEVSLAVTGDLAVIKLTNTCFGCNFTDNLSLIKDDGQWQIISKIYFAHPA